MSRPPSSQLLSKLPIDDSIPAILESLARHPSLILQAAPGTGKTTRVPPALLNAPYLDPAREILVLEPRRLAAKMSARRVAQERGEAVGETIGYQFRFENVTSRATRVRYLTEGMLMRRLMNEPKLQSVSCVILDEFHERHLHSDVALAFLRHLQKTARPDLRIVVMSATLDIGNLARYLGQENESAPVLQIDAKRFDVSVEYLPQAPAKHLDLTVKDAVLNMLGKTPGDILVFLPGMGEIRRCASALESIAASRNILIAPLHGELSREEQDVAVHPGEMRKVILSTNVAETSLTIEGVTGVIDSGLHRMASHSWWSGVPALRTRPISRASAIQRAGRAGRTAPGHCLRLYTRGEFDSRPMFEAPEIQRADLAQTLLELGALGVEDPEAFAWFERPQAQSLEASRALLYRLGAVERPSARAPLTPMGRRMAQLGSHPRIGRMLLESERLGVLEATASLAAFLLESRLEGLDALSFVQSARMEESIWRVRSALLSFFEKRPLISNEASPSSLSKEDRLRFAILCGYPDRVARKRPGQDPKAAQLELLFSSGGSTRIENSATIAEHEAFVILDLRETQHMGQQRTNTQIQSLCAIQPEWLFDLAPTALEEREEPIWDEARKRVLLSSRLVYDQLVLSQSRSEWSHQGKPHPEAASVMLKQAFGLDASRLNSLNAHEFALALAPATDPQELESLVVRLTLVGQSFPESKFPDFITGGEACGRVYVKVFTGKMALTEIQSLDWTSELISACESPYSSYQLDELTPLFVALASGRRAQVNYALNQAPWVESRLQDFFGMKKGPSILRGRTPLTLHLLAPNQRAVQVTTDLEGFWQRVYPELRHQLSRRYPRHSWPEKP